MVQFANASPAYILQGADDKGSRPLPAERLAVPQHVPLVYMFASKGTTAKLLASGGAATLNYGAETFSPGSKYFGHTNRLATELYGAGNVCMNQRLVPTDAGIKSNVVLYADVLSTTVPNYVRNSTGDKVIDVNTNAFMVDAVTPTIAGTRIKFITEVSQLSNLGVVPSKAGTMTDGATTSTMYPILETRAAFNGLAYNDLGWAIESLVGDAVDQAIVTNLKALPYKLGLVERSGPGASPQALRSLFGEPSVTCVLKAGTKHPVTTLKLDVKSVFDSNWYNETDPLKSIRYNDYEGMFVYNSNLDLILTGIMTNEKSYISSIPQVWDDGLSTATSGWYDYTTTDATGLDAETYLINLFTGKSTKSIDYFTLELDETAPTLTVGQKEVHISRDTPIFMAGGSDGTLDNAMFETLVTIEMAKYLDPNSEVIDNAINVETHLYDSGFTTATKSELLNFIAVRKDTVVALGTHDAANTATALVLSDTRAIAVLLKTQAKLFPESDFFGTPTARAVILGGAYQLYSDLDKNFLPLTFELAIKTARMMGAGDYKWRSTYNFDHGSNAVLIHGQNYEPKFIPAGIKPTLWNDGMVWAQPKDRRTYFIPGIQTVYDDDTSPLNNWFTICGLVTLNRIASDAWREHTGTSTMSDAQFKEVVLSYLNRRLEGIFDGLLVAIPEVIITDQDAQRGFSWKIMYRLYAGNMKTTMVSYTEVYRMNSL